jgi:hypothetical protein
MFYTESFHKDRPTGTTRMEVSEPTALMPSKPHKPIVGIKMPKEFTLKYVHRVVCLRVISQNSDFSTLKGQDSDSTGDVTHAPFLSLAPPLLFAVQTKAQMLEGRIAGTVLGARPTD